MTRTLLILCVVMFGCSAGQDTRQRARDAWIADWQARLANGEHHVSLYSTVNTNLLLRSISGHPSVETLVIRQAIDLDETGLAEVSRFPALSALTISGEKALNDRNIRFVTSCTRLSALELECTGITSACFPLLAELDNLSSLNIETCDPNEVYDDEDVLALANLKRLRYLNLNGAASPAALRELANRLPACTIGQVKQ